MVDNTAAEVDASFNRLIEAGSQLLIALNAERTIEPKHISIIRNWISEALELIEPSTPPDDAEFENLCEVREKYSAEIHILPGDTSEHIRQVLAGLRTAYEYFKVWCNFDWSQMAAEERASMCYESLRETWQFSRNKLIGSLKGKEDGRTKRTALLHSYGRMYRWVLGMVQLGAERDKRSGVAEHCLTLAGCLRAILEIFLDMNLLRRDIVQNGVERFFSFQKVERFRIARNSLDLNTAFEHLRKEQLYKIQRYIDSGSGAACDVKNCIVNLWGRNKKGKPKHPTHWTGMTVIDRAKAMGKEFVQFYQHTYHYCNWSLHSGYSDFPANREDALLFAAHAYNKANEMFLRSTNLLIEELTFLNIADFATELRKVQLSGAHFLWQAAVKAQQIKGKSD